MGVAVIPPQEFEVALAANDQEWQEEAIKGTPSSRYFLVVRLVSHWTPAVGDISGAVSRVIAALGVLTKVMAG